MNKTKILMVGPREAGKTAIANFLSESSESSGGDYWPTQGCRILEFEVPALKVNGKLLDGEVELWDVSGNTKYEACWPAILRDASGVVFVYNPDKKEHERDMDFWHQHFVRQPNLKHVQCIVFSHRKPTAPERETVSLSSTFDNITSVKTNLEEDPDNCRKYFNKFLGDLLGKMSDNREQEELSIMNERSLT